MGRKQINQAQRDRLDGTASNVSGWLVFWSITEAERSVNELRASAQAAGLSQQTIDRINGRTPRTAWYNATQLGSQGKQSVTLGCDVKGSTARYITRNLRESSRALLREVINVDGERVDTYQVATIYDLSQRIEFTIDRNEVAKHAGQYAEQMEADIRRVIARMQSEMDAMVGSVDDDKIRDILLSWLNSVYRICVRGTGGVYFVPRPRTGPAQMIEDEMIALRKWVNSNPINSTFSIVEVSSGGATTVGDFAQSALTEMRTEIDDIHANLRKWSANGNMNDGSKMFSAETQINRAHLLVEKAKYLTDSLGEELFVLVTLAEKALKESQEMYTVSSSVVEASRAAKTAAKAEKEEKKSGTAKQRAAKQSVE